MYNEKGYVGGCILMLPSLICFPTFAILLSLHVATFYFVSLVNVTFSSRCMFALNIPITKQQKVYPHRLPALLLAEESPTLASVQQQ